MPPALQRALSSSLKVRICDALEEVFVDDSEFAEALNRVDVEIKRVAPVGELLRAKIMAAVKIGHRQGFLLPLIAEVRKMAPADVELARIEQQLKTLAVNVLPAGVDPLQACRLTAGHILVNRTQLRRALEELSNPEGKRVLVVKDDPAFAGAGAPWKTGKSHSLQLILYLAQATQNFRAVIVDLEELARAVGTGKLIEPRDLGGLIATLSGCKQIVQPKPDDTTWARWTLEFCIAFEAAVVDSDPIWIVLDQFHKVLLSQDTIDLVKDLAKRIGTTLPNFRLVLLGYTGSLHPSTLPEEETLHLINENELGEFFRRALQERSIEPTPEQVAMKVLTVLEGADPSLPDYHEKLGALAMLELRKQP
jgi:hypothetical protein